MGRRIRADAKRKSEASGGIDGGGIGSEEMGKEDTAMEWGYCWQPQPAGDNLSLYE